MSLYARYIFPPLLDWAMGRGALQQLRPGVVGEARGEVLEIGFGTGRNLPFYAAQVEQITALEPSEAVARRARGRVAESPVPVRWLHARADAPLPLDADRFDTVLSTWTLCSVDDPGAALAEVHRVLKPGGRLVFIEHGLARSARVARWQHRLTPINRRIGQGCRLDRDFAALLERSPFAEQGCEEFDVAGTPRLAAHHYRGKAVKR